MIKEFIDFVEDLFPSISPYTKDQVKKAVNQFNEHDLKWFMDSKLDYLSQGDIIQKLPFTFDNSDGSRNVIFLKGIVLSNSCDIDHDDRIVVAPLFFTNDILSNPDSIKIMKQNKHFDKMCFTNSELGDYFVDFTRTTSFNRQLILNLLDSKTKVEYSLSLYGFYLLITKLTMYFLRPEDKETNASRA